MNHFILAFLNHSLTQEPFGLEAGVISPSALGWNSIFKKHDDDKDQTQTLVVEALISYYEQSLKLKLVKIQMFLLYRHP